MTRLDARTVEPEAAALTEDDLERVRKARAKAPHEGGAWHSWSRILEAVELAKLAQEAVAEANIGGPA